jgi:hypothetical protein
LPGNPAHHSTEEYHLNGTIRSTPAAANRRDDRPRTRPARRGNLQCTCVRSDGSKPVFAPLRDGVDGIID